MKISIPKTSSDDVLNDLITAKDNRSTAKICVVGDPVDAQEIIEQAPFTGVNYKQFNRLSSAINVPRHEMYLTNCTKVPFRRSKTKSGYEYSKLMSSKGYRSPDFYKLQEKLIDEISLCESNIIICSGITATTLLLDDPSIDSITKYRGSVYRCDDILHLKDKLKGKLILITYSLFDCSPRINPINFYVLINDFNKALDLYDDPSLIDVKPIIHINPTFTDIMNYLDRVDEVKETSVDIEATPKYITCIALTVSPIEGMCIPFMNNSGNMWTPLQEAQIWYRISLIMEDESIGKIFQNGMFDTMYMLRTLDIKINNFIFDTMIAQHICWTDLPKGLDFLVSTYSYFPYYKDDGKQSHLKAIKDWNKYWEYNCKDAIYTHFIKAPLEKELIKFDALKDFDYMMNLHAPLMEMEYNGILTDTEGLAKEKIRLERKIKSLQKGVLKIIGQDLNFNSPKQMVAYFYGTLGIKPYINRKTGNATCDAVALSRIAKRGGKGSHAAKMIIKYREYKKLVSTYFNVIVDKDNRLRCTYKIAGTVSGRLASAGTYFGTGTNLQNQPKEFKIYLIADKLYIITELDLAKAEAHCVAYLSQDANMIQSFLSGIDVHSFNASKIFDVDIDSVTKNQRNMGKRVVHASNYHMGPQTFSDNLAKDNIFISTAECKKLLIAYQNRFPGLRRWHESIDAEVSQTRILYNLFGRPKRFLGMLDDTTFRNAYSYKPQSTVAELLNRGMIKIYHDPFFKKPEHEFKFLATVHDSILFMTPIKHIKHLPNVYQQMHKHLSHEFTYKGRSFIIGLDGKVGTSWGKGMIEFPNFAEETVYEACAKLGLM